MQSPDIIDRARAVLANGMAAGKPRDALKALVDDNEALTTSLRMRDIERATTIRERDDARAEVARLQARCAELEAENEVSVRDAGHNWCDTLRCIEDTDGRLPVRGLFAIEIGDDEPGRGVIRGGHYSGSRQRDPLDRQLDRIIAKRASHVECWAVPQKPSDLAPRQPAESAASGVEPWTRLGWEWKGVGPSVALFDPLHISAVDTAVAVGFAHESGNWQVYKDAEDASSGKRHGKAATREAAKLAAWNALCDRVWHGLSASDRTYTPLPNAVAVTDAESRDEREAAALALAPHPAPAVDGGGEVDCEECAAHDEADRRTRLRRAITVAVNGMERDYGNTPDYVLADVAMDAMDAFARASLDRDKHCTARELVRVGSITVGGEK